MKEVISTVSSKGQITIPIEVRKHLQVGEGDKLSFVIEDGGAVRVEAPKYRDIASLRGAAGSLKASRSLHEMREVARDDHLSEITRSR